MLMPTKVAINADVLFQEMEERVVLLNIRNEQYYGLKDVAARFWQLLQEDGSTERALSTVCTEYGVDSESARRDLLAFLGTLHAAGLVEFES